jgi:hypothetical protein
MLSGVMLSVVMLSVVASLRTQHCCFHGKFRGRLVEQNLGRLVKYFRVRMVPRLVGRHLKWVGLTTKADLSSTTIGDQAIALIVMN